MWFLPLIQVLWVNVQGLFVLQFVVLGCFLADRLFRQWSAHHRDSHQQTGSWTQWMTVVVLTIGASLINPYGIRGALFPLILFQRVRGPQREFYSQLSGELDGMGKAFESGGASLYLHCVTHSMMTLIFLGCVVTFILLYIHRRFNLYHVLLFAAFGYLAWQMVRNCSLFAIVAGVVLRWNVCELFSLAKSASDNRSQRKERRPQVAERPRYRLATWLVGSCLGLLIISVPTNFYSLYFADPSLATRYFGLRDGPMSAHAAARFLNQEGLPKHVFAAELRQAAVCIYHLCPNQRVFTDARLELNTQETLRRYSDIIRQLACDDPRIIDNLTYNMSPHDREVPALLLDNVFLSMNPTVAQCLLHSDMWRCVYTEQRGSFGASVFVTEELAEQLDMPAVDISFLDPARQ